MDLHKLFIIIPSGTVKLERVVEDSKGYTQRVYFHKDSKSIVIDGDIYGGDSKIDIDPEETNKVIRDYLKDNLENILKDGPLKEIEERVTALEGRVDTVETTVTQVETKIETTIEKELEDAEININTDGLWEEL